MTIEMKSHGELIDVTIILHGKTEVLNNQYPYEVIGIIQRLMERFVINPD